MSFVKKDHFLFGLLLGIVLPVAMFLFILLVNYILVILNFTGNFLPRETHLLVSLFINLLPIRYYFVNLTYDKTGRGVLLITFVAILLFFIFKDNLELSL